jgi:hypothetical protein
MSLVKITREELYAQIWETPLSRVAKKIGMTPTGLIKVCRRLEVPYPAAGYCAKRAYRKETPQTPPPKSSNAPPLARWKQYGQRKKLRSGRPTANPSRPC